MQLERAEFCINCKSISFFDVRFNKIIIDLRKHKSKVVKMRIVLFLIIAIYFIAKSDGNPNPPERTEQGKRSFAGLDVDLIGTDRK